MTRTIDRALFLCCLSILGCSPSSLLAELDRDGGLDAGSPAALRDLCGNGVDDDGDGRIDDGCPCGPREMQRCFPGPISERGVGTCTDGVQRCVLGGSEWGDWGDAPCEGAIVAEAEVCDGQDHDCDGARDEDCSCMPSETRECGASFLNAPCMAGTQSCSPSGTWTECVGAIGPTTDICDGIDNDCDGVIDLGCSCVPEPEICDDGIDNDCDRRIDEPACRPDWPICTVGTPGWISLPTANAPATLRIVAVWTGDEILVWETSFPRDMLGRRFNLARHEWSVFTNAGEPPSPRRHPAVAWTGREMLVWGGWDDVRSMTVSHGSAFDPTTNTWRAMSTLSEPSPRDSFASVWTGREFIVWGGAYREEAGTESTLLNDGGIYDPETDTWRAMSTAGAPAPLTTPYAVWTGREMIVWQSTGGGIFNPSTNSWRPLETADGPGQRFNPVVVWTGREMAVWSGSGAGSYFTTGRLFDPNTNRWREMNTVGAPAPRSTLMSVERSQVALPTRQGFLVWGGLLAGSSGASGAMYDAATETWTAIPTEGAPESRYGHVALWTGCSFFMWGGYLNPDVSPGGIWTPE